MPVHSWLLVLTQAKPSLVTVAASDSCGTSIKFLQQPDFPFGAHSSCLAYKDGKGADPCSEKAQKVLGTTFKMGASIWLKPRPKNLLAGGNPTAQHMASSRCLPCQWLGISLLKFTANKVGGQESQTQNPQPQTQPQTPSFFSSLPFPSAQFPALSFFFSHN